MCTIRHGKRFGETLKLSRLSRVSGASWSRPASWKLQRLGLSSDGLVHTPVKHSRWTAKIKADSGGKVLGNEAAPAPSHLPTLPPLTSQEICGAQQAPLQRGSGQSKRILGREKPRKFIRLRAGRPDILPQVFFIRDATDGHHHRCS